MEELKLASNQSHQPKVYLVGAGPGDPELITLKGVKALEAADVVLYDALSNDALLQHAPVNAMKIFVGKRRGYQAKSQDETNALILKYSREYQTVVRLKGGDPFVFGRGYEEMEFLARHGIFAEYVPGISSAISVPGIAGIPITFRGQTRSFHVLTASKTKGVLNEEILQAPLYPGIVVILMGLSHLSDILDIYQSHKLDEYQVSIIQNGSLPSQREVFGSVQDISQKVQDSQISTPAIIVIGQLLKSFKKNHRYAAVS